MRSDRGSGTVLVLGVLAVLVLAAVTVTSLAAVGVARHRASTAADLAALAAAGRAASGAAAACAHARRAAEGAGVRLASCGLDGQVAEVVTALRPPGWLGTLGEAVGRARAGPAAAGG